MTKTKEKLTTKGGLKARLAEQKARADRAERSLQAAKVLMNQFDSMNGTQLRSQLDAEFAIGSGDGQYPQADNVFKFRVQLTDELMRRSGKGRIECAQFAHGIPDGLSLNLLYEAEGDVKKAVVLFLHRGLAVGFTGKPR